MTNSDLEHGITLIELKAVRKDINYRKTILLLPKLLGSQFFILLRFSVVTIMSTEL